MLTTTLHIHLCVYNTQSLVYQISSLLMYCIVLGSTTQAQTMAHLMGLIPYFPGNTVLPSLGALLHQTHHGQSI
jgi:hypothetical protein